MNYLQKKKLAFMSIANQIKGFVRTVSGVPPLTLPDCVDEDSLINYKIDGNSVQNGTPTPEAPIEVENVGELTKNMFDKDGFCKYYNSFGTLKANANDNYLGEDCFSYYLCYPSPTSTEFRWMTGEFKENTSYTFSCYAAMKWAGVESKAISYLLIRYTDGTFAYVNATLYTDRFTKIKFVTNSSKTIKSISMGNYAAVVPIYIKDFQIEEGATATDYEPYSKYKIPVICSDGKGKSVTTNIYLDEPLRKIEDYADYIDFENEKLIQHIYHEKITAVLQRSSLKGFLSEISKCPIKTGAGLNVRGAMSDKFEKAVDGTRYDTLFEQSGAIGTYITSDGAYRIAYSFKDNSINTVELANEAIGDGFDVYYRLDTPLEIDIDLPKLPTIKGTTIISADTELQPSNMKVTYYSISKE